MKLSAYEIALIAGGFSIIGALLGGWIGYRFSLCLSKINARSKAGNDLRSSFASQLAYLRGYEGSIEETETIRKKLYSEFISIHAAELQKFRFYITSSEVGTYDKACEKYEETLHPGLIVKPKDQEPSEFFIAEIEKLLALSK